MLSLWCKLKNKISLHSILKRHSVFSLALSRTLIYYKYKGTNKWVKAKLIWLFWAGDCNITICTLGQRTFDDIEVKDSVDLWWNDRLIEQIVSKILFRRFVLFTKCRLVSFLTNKTKPFRLPVQHFVLILHRIYNKV